MWIKICGNTRLEDCLAAADLGASAVGFVFAQGKRTVTATQVAQITVRLPSHLQTFGVFTTPVYEEIITAVKESGLTGVQLHSETPDFGLLNHLRAYFGSAGHPSVIQVTHRWTDLSESEQGPAFAATVNAIVREGSADALLIDSKTREGSGGTGKGFDWAAAKPTLDAIPMRVILAGGLRPENVADAVHILSPWGVDVSSGVETSPGIKDHKAIARFISQARSGTAQ